MKKLLIKILKPLGLRFKKRSYTEAVQKAEELHKKTNQKCLVFFSGGEFKVVTKQTLRNGKKNGFFKGESYAEIEKRALYVAPRYLKAV